MLAGGIGFLFGFIVAALVFLMIVDWYLALLLTIGATVLCFAVKWGRVAGSISKKPSSHKNGKPEKPND